jgi:hypothetical protein
MTRKLRLSTVSILLTAGIAADARAETVNFNSDQPANALVSPEQTAQAASGVAGSSAPGVGVADSIADYFETWFVRVDAALASQPHWMTPLATVTPRLEEEVRYDQFWQSLGNGATIDNFDGGKGLELIPTTTNEIILGVPPYEIRSNVKPVSGFGDDQFLLIKQRLLSANEDSGNYILTGFLSFQAPTGITALTDDSWLITPTIAGGFGIGDFDVQSTFGVAFPTSHEATIGYQFNTNVALQYHIDTLFWPEFEVNDTYWSGGERDGKNQVVLTPGLILGRFDLGGRLRGSIGGGYQFAVSPTLTREPALTPTFNHAWILSARVSF